MESALSYSIQFCLSLSAGRSRRREYGGSGRMCCGGKSLPLEWCGEEGMLCNEVHWSVLLLLLLLVSSWINRSPPCQTGHYSDFSLRIMDGLIFDLHAKFVGTQKEESKRFRRLFSCQETESHDSNVILCFCSHFHHPPNTRCMRANRNSRFHHRWRVACVPGLRCQC